jgi:hypothetical protein
MEFVSLVFVIEDDSKSAEQGIAIEAADAGGGLVRKHADDKNGSYIELSTAVCIVDSSVVRQPS